MDVIEDAADDDLVIVANARRPIGPANWSFVRRPRWILSHLFAATLIVGFLGAGLWQLDRLSQRQDTNERIEARALQTPMPLASVLGAPDDDLDYTAVSATGRFVESELARVANRSQDGRGGDWVVAIFETDEGHLLIVNRGFVLRSEVTAETPNGTVELEGLLRRSRTKGWVGGTDNPEAERMPRLNVDDVMVRMGRAGIDPDRVVPLWLQLDAIDGADPGIGVDVGLGVEAVVTPRPIPLDGIDEGNHFSYAVQWFLMATLSVVIYGLMLRRIAHRPA